MMGETWLKLDLGTAKYIFCLEIKHVSFCCYLTLAKKTSALDPWFLLMSSERWHEWIDFGRVNHPGRSEHVDRISLTHCPKTSNKQNFLWSTFNHYKKGFVSDKESS